MGINLRYWNVRKDGRLVLRPNVHPMGIYVSFDPVQRKFMRHNVYPLEADGAAWLPIDASRISCGAVAEALAVALVGVDYGKP